MYIWPTTDIIYVNKHFIDDHHDALFVNIRSKIICSDPSIRTLYFAVWFFPVEILQTDYLIVVLLLHRVSAI